MVFFVTSTAWPSCCGIWWIRWNRRTLPYSTTKYIKTTMMFSVQLSWWINAMIYSQWVAISTIPRNAYYTLYVYAHIVLLSTLWIVTRYIHILYWSRTNWTGMNSEVKYATEKYHLIENIWNLNFDSRLSCRVGQRSAFLNSLTFSRQLDKLKWLITWCDVPLLTPL